MYRADLTECIVVGARFCRSDLREAALWDTDFSRADLTEAVLDGAIRDPPRPSALPTAPLANFGEWLRRQRESRGMSPDELADQIGYGLSGYDVTMLMEKKSDGPGPQLTQRLAEVFCIAVSDVPGRQLGK